MNKIEKERRRILKFKYKHPNICICDKHKDNDVKIKEDIRYSIYDYEQINPIPCNIFRCSKCGKEYNDSPAEA